MIYAKPEIWQACKIEGAKHLPDFGPYTLMGLGEEECHHPDGDLDLFDASVVRKEQYYYEKYVRRRELATTVESQFADSWGVWQTMGLSLYETKNSAGQNFYEWWFSRLVPIAKAQFEEPLTPFAVTAALNEYCVTLPWMVEWAALHFKGKLKIAGGDLGKALDLWNGDLTGAYRQRVLDRIKRLKGELQ